MSDRVNILLVDDDTRNLDVLESILTSSDYRLVRATTANEALLALVSQEFAVLVLDIRMPDLSGLELAQLIKQRKKTENIPIIFLTAYYQEDKDVLEGYGAGAVDYLSKPVNPLIFKSKVDVFVDLFRKTQTLALMNRSMESEIVRKTERLKASLVEKETLLKEIHHRVKNNLQIISSLISLQAENLKDPMQQRLFRDTCDRVKSMALVHEKLYQSKDLARVELAEYTRHLMNELLQAGGPAGKKVRLQLELEPVYLTVDAAIPCGLILNELTTNSLKHAFRDRATGEIAVQLRSGPDDLVRVRFHDDGQGFPKDIDWRRPHTLGLQLLQMLTKQLHGTMEIANGQGMDFRLSFNQRSNENVTTQESTVR
jgi:two-component sensor histidine kinase